MFMHKTFVGTGFARSRYSMGKVQETERENDITYFAESHRYIFVSYAAVVSSSSRMLTDFNK